MMLQVYILSLQCCLVIMCIIIVSIKQYIRFSQLYEFMLWSSDWKIQALHSSETVPPY